MRHLHQDARAVARVGLAAARAAMVQVDQNLQPLPDNFVGRLPLMLTTKPTPQASCSNQGSYKPCLLGKPLLFISD